MNPSLIAHARGSGINESERYLKSLSDKSFLSLWSFAGVYNDKGKGKEICDLLVVFGNDVIIFSDKNCSFSPARDVKVEWKRWFKKSILKSIDQVNGAERWIRNHPDRVFLDHKCSVPFPINLPSNEQLRIHRVIVTHSIAEHCKKYLDDGDGSLVYSSICRDDEQPFIFGLFTSHEGFYHVLDDRSLDVLMNTLDTASDFIGYLSRKEQFLSQATMPIMYFGEEQLLAIYLQHYNENNEHEFPSIKHLENKFGCVVYDVGFWDTFERSQERKNQIKANEISYLWDEHINFFNELYETEGQISVTSSSYNEYETILRHLAKENRFRRRILSEAFVGFYNNNNFPMVKASRTILPTPGSNDPHYLFVMLPRDPDQTDEEAGKFLHGMVTMHCHVTKLKFREAKTIIGIGCESGAPQASFRTIVIFKDSDFDRKKAIEAKRFMEKHRMYGSGHFLLTALEEYPINPDVRNFSVLIDRSAKMANKPCPCGSGKKQKKCHGIR